MTSGEEGYTLTSFERRAYNRATGRTGQRNGSGTLHFFVTNIQILINISTTDFKAARPLLVVLS